MSLNHLEMNPTAAPCVMVIFGATGDLTKRKLLPAICNLAQDKLLPDQFAIVGFATNDYTTESFRKMLAEEIPKYAPAPFDPKFWREIAERIYYVRGDFQDTEAFKRLKDQIDQADKLHNTLGNRFFYLAFQALESLGILKIASDVVNALGDFAPELRVERGWSILGNFFRQHLPKTLGRVVVGCESHDGELFRKKFVLSEIADRGKQFAFGEVAGCAENNHYTRRRSGVHVQMV